jgi:hypothetical protein
MLNKLLILLIGIAFVGTNSIHACTCKDVSVEQAFDNSSIVFSGQLVGIRDTLIKNENDSLPGDGYNIFTFTVIDNYKGEKREYEVLTPWTSGACGVSGEMDDEFLVFAKMKGELFFTSICNRTKLLRHAVGDIEVISQNGRLTANQSITIRYCDEMKSKDDNCSIKLLSIIDNDTNIIEQIDENKYLRPNLIEGISKDSSESKFIILLEQCKFIYELAIPVYQFSKCDVFEVCITGNREKGLSEYSFSFCGSLGFVAYCKRKKIKNAK